MDRKTDKPRYFITKKLESGKILYYWQPSAQLRKQGHLPRRLSDQRSEALAQAKQYNRELDEARTSSGVEPKLSSNSPVAAVIKTYKKSPKFTSKADATQRIYCQCLDRIENWCGDIEIASIPRTSIIEFHQTLYKETPAFANAIGRMLRILFKYAYNQGLIETNHAIGLELPGQPPRQQVWSRSDQEKFLSAAKDAGWPSMALAVLLGVCTAQRQADILALTWLQVSNHEIRLRQKKTKRWVSIPILSELKTALDHAALERFPNNEFIVVCETTKKRYQPDHFRHLFREIANKAGLHHLQFRDLRRTAIVRLAEAGISTPGITSISGHETGHCERILETYMPRNSEMAREAMRQFEEYRRRMEKEDEIDIAPYNDRT